MLHPEGSPSSSNFTAFVSLNGGGVDPDDYFYRTFYTGASTNVFKFSDKEMDKQLDAGRASLTFEQSIWRGQVLLSRSTIRVGCVDAKTLRPCRFPQPVLDALHNAATAKAG
jgi:hypothetical protein